MLYCLYQSHLYSSKKTINRISAQLKQNSELYKTFPVIQKCLLNSLSLKRHFT